MKKAIAILLAAVLALSLAACGGDNGNTPTTTQGTTPTTTTSENTTTSTSQEETSTETTPIITDMSKDDMLAIADEVNLTDIETDLSDNRARAEATYIGNTYIASGFVLEIESDYCEIISSYNYITFRLRAYIPKDDLIEISPDNKITIVGTIDKFDVEQSTVNGTTHDNEYVEMQNAYYVGDIHEITGNVYVMNSFISIPNGNKSGSIDDLYFYIADENSIRYKLPDNAISNFERGRDGTSATVLGVNINFNNGTASLSSTDTITVSGQVRYNSKNWNSNGEKFISFDGELIDVTLSQ
jgi:uncharacterized protein YdeI (BOF family)